MMAWSVHLQAFHNEVDRAHLHLRESDIDEHNFLDDLWKSRSEESR